MIGGGSGSLVSFAHVTVSLNYSINYANRYCFLPLICHYYKRTAETKWEQISDIATKYITNAQKKNRKNHKKNYTDYVEVGLLSICGGVRLLTS